MTENNGDTLEQKKSASYYKGFFDCEQRRPQKTPDDSATRSIVSSILSALPIALLIFYISRRNAKRAVEQATPTTSGAKKGFFSNMMDEMQRQMNPMAEKSFLVNVKDTKFKDVVGVPEALMEVKQYVEFLKDPTRFVRLGGRLPKGCLLTGKPGTGKTLLARAVAGEADVPFFSCSGSDFIEVYAGSGPKRVRELFESAKKSSPSVIFVDEIDAVGARSNGQGAGGISSEENRTVNQLLAELDGLKKDEAVVVFAATNFPDNLDKALLREGRFDRKVEIPMPDKEAREDLFTHYLKKVVTGDPESATAASMAAATATAAAPSSASAASPTSATPPQPPQPAVEVVPGTNKRLAERMAKLTPGVSPATIAAIVNEAALAAALAGEPVVSEKKLLPAIDDVLVGKKHRSRMKIEASRRVALHEAGHALVAWYLPQQPLVIKVSITPRGNAAGFTQQIGRETLDHQTDTTMFTDICVMLGGRIGELTSHTTLTTGAQDDFQRATKLAINQFLAFGMSRELGLLSFDYQRLDQGRMYQLVSESTQNLAEKEAVKLVDIAYAFTSDLVREHRKQLDALAQLLYEKKELMEEDIRSVLGDRPEWDRSATDPKITKALEGFTQKAFEAASSADHKDQNQQMMESPTTTSSTSSSSASTAVSKQQQEEDQQRQEGAAAAASPPRRRRRQQQLV